MVSDDHPDHTYPDLPVIDVRARALAMVDDNTLPLPTLPTYLRRQGL